jgi:hypothetical protein
VPREELFKAHGIHKATGYRILKTGTARRSERIHNRGRKPILAPWERDAIEQVEDSNFRFAASTHLAVASSIGLAHGSERAIQGNMADHGLGTFMAAQKKPLQQTSIDARNIWQHDHRYWQLDDFKRYRYSDESHFATGLQRQARIHRRRGQKYRDMLSKTQYKLKRQNQCLHVFGVIGWDYKMPKLHFYTGSGKGGRLLQTDYALILEKVVAPNWQQDWILLEDNDQAHGTRSKPTATVNVQKCKLGVRTESNCPESPDLNPIENIWRIIKQRLKSRGLFWHERELQLAIEEEWDKITLEEINTAIGTMPDRVKALEQSFGKPIAY